MNHNPERVSDILPRVLAHIWSATRFEYGSSINHCSRLGCRVKRRIVGKRTEYWLDGQVTKLPPPCSATDAA